MSARQRRRPLVESMGPCSLVELPRHEDQRGTLGVAELGGVLPFLVRRFYLIGDVPEATRRGGHTKRTTHQLLVAVRGRVDVELRGSGADCLVRLDSPFVGLHVPPLVQSAQEFFDDAVLLVCASETYDPSDYVDPTEPLDG